MRGTPRYYYYYCYLVCHSDVYLLKFGQGTCLFFSPEDSHAPSCYSISLKKEQFSFDFGFSSTAVQSGPRRRKRALCHYPGHDVGRSTNHLVICAAAEQARFEC